MTNYDVFEFEGQGYKKLFNHHDWRVSILNYIEELELDQISYVESHQFTDEAFVLLEGSCTIFFADAIDMKIKSISAIHLEKNKVYKINAGIFHTHTLSKDAKLLIIEEDNTCETNSPKIMLNEKERRVLNQLYREKKHAI